MSAINSVRCTYLHTSAGLCKSTTTRASQKTVVRRQHPQRPTALFQNVDKFCTQAFSRKSQTQSHRGVFKPCATAAADAAAPTPSVFSGAKEGFDKRMEADPRFLYKLCVECGVDQLITMIANLSAFGLNPALWTTPALASAILLHFTAIFNDIVLVWCLAPVAGAKVGNDPKISHMFQEEEGVTTSDRVKCWFDKFKLYAIVGSITAFFGGILTILITRTALLPIKLARTAFLGAVHLGISANTRYQCVNGIELVMSKCLPAAVANAGTLVVRTSNNFLGARVFLLLAALLNKF